MNNLLTPKGKCRNSVLFLAFLLLSCLGVSSLSAQNLKESGITLKVQNENVEKVFNQITNLTNFKFFYDQEIVNSAPRVSLDINKGTLKEILSEITAQTKLFFNRTNNTIAVSANPKGNAGETKKMKTLSGVVVDENGEPVKPETPNGYKFESLVLDMIHQMDSCLPFEVVRRKEFAPIKNKTGVDSVESARELLVENGVVL